MGRKLTNDEKRKVTEHARKIDAARFPDAVLSIIVEDEIDDDGRVHWRTCAVKESVGLGGI